MSYKCYTSQFKYEVLMSYKNEHLTVSEVLKKYHISEYIFYKWMEKFNKGGISGLENSNTRNFYSKEAKVAAVKEYLSGEYSKEDVVRRHNLSSRSVLSRWINKYNSHRELKDSGKGRTRSMTKKRTTTWEERRQIAIYCLENGKDYHGTAEKYEVSYQQVYQWVKKYLAGGAEALEDRRGRTKEEAELSPEEKVKLEMKRLERENERLKAENAYLKKLEEIERGQR
ncbi:helix-turn-helix domain-containing protein [Rossellomorea vietnamensis]|uniref:Helix-turn-helix domain-containing protein n=1 Tax=Rossellomorea vietnamensis TaxID=218284 RepID=A0A5D4MHZ1_9BACI|nr:helix-turn-helix domain-containing protein [Rossellomorea vietnamensis]TYS00999.1 helix-turn-helix domain-containing protein [Rossellomorea vietnamensis]